MIRAIEKLMAPLRRRVLLTIGRAVIKASRAEGGFMTVQVTALDGEILDGLPLIQDYGFASRPRSGAQGVIACVGGNRRAALVIATEDKRYRLQLGEDGESAIYDDLGQKVHLTRAGIVIETTLPIEVNAASVAIDAAAVTMTGSLTVDGIIASKVDVKANLGSGDELGLDQLRDTYNGHTHPGDSGGTTGAPNQTV